MTAAAPVTTGLRVPPLACPECRGALVELRCVACGVRFDEIDGIPVLLAATDEHKRRQAAYFDAADDAEWEIERPHGAPRLHRLLLEEKLRRATTGIDVSGATVLVVCGGSGMDAELLARAGARVITSDLSLGAARRARERARRRGFDVLSIVADAERLPLPDGAVDVAFVHDGLHHLEDPARALAELARVGRAVSVNEPARATLTALAVKVGLALDREDAGNRVERLSLDGTVAALRTAGFRVVGAERYAMLYRHRPGLPMRALSRGPLPRIVLRALRLLDRAGNKLTVRAVREGGAR